MNIKDMVIDGRLKTGLTQEELAKALGCHQMTVSQIERGVVSIPTKHAMNLCRILKLEKGTFVKAYLDDKMEHIKRSLK